jgi:hypothetical protein
MSIFFHQISCVFTSYVDFGKTLLKQSSSFISNTSTSLQVVKCITTIYYFMRISTIFTPVQSAIPTPPLLLCGDTGERMGRRQRFCGEPATATGTAAGRNGGEMGRGGGRGGGQRRLELGREALLRGGTGVRWDVAEVAL